jgi:hypothetical protein
MAAMEHVLHVHHRLIGLELGDIAVDERITKALRGAELACPSRWTRARRASNARAGVHRGTHDIIRDAKWSQPAGFRHLAGRRCK